MQDKNGREYARLSVVKAGETVCLDDGFTCTRPWVHKVVQQDEAGELYFRCHDGKHMLDGQLADDGDSLMGIYPMNMS